MFYEASYKAPQGTSFGRFILSGRLSHRRVAEPKKKRLITWTYIFKVEVCRSFILGGFQISEKKLRVVKSKWISGSGYISNITTC